jgi:UDP-N-acetylglucosamine:LPS N-acetylglucosamine transferase
LGKALFSNLQAKILFYAFLPHVLVGVGIVVAGVVTLAGSPLAVEIPCFYRRQIPPLFRCFAFG